jgi:hypothetical protein
MATTGRNRKIRNTYVCCLCCCVFIRFCSLDLFCLYLFVCLFCYFCNFLCLCCVFACFVCLFLFIFVLFSSFISELQRELKERGKGYLITQYAPKLTEKLGTKSKRKKEKARNFNLTKQEDAQTQINVGSNTNKQT